MVGGGLPDVPDPIKVADSVMDGMKVVADRTTAIAQVVAEGLGKMVITSTKGVMTSVDHVAKDIMSGVEGNINIGKATADSIKSSLQATAEGIRSQVDRGIGEEVVRKLKGEVERQLR